ncbi:fumarylacetoacetate hydrolase family protein [Dactylosporangium sp. CA-152071]|uniref:fumarylacetoacetate hydrolase family protein n=1 Tax=Dactylosporangium sp. CA-152071 TaxID=3239933 RepID=UPI003D90CD0A
MKLVRYGPPGAERPGVLDAAGAVRDLSAHIADIDPDGLAPQRLARLARLDVDRLPAVPTPTRIGPCLGRVGKIVGVGLNYRSHADEARMPLPDEPLLFLKPASAVSGPNDPVLLPPLSTTTDYEVELGVVIGRTARQARTSEAMGHVAGYCIVNDITERTWQLHRGGTWDKGKAHDTFAPIGPWLVTTDEIPDPHGLAMRLRVDNETRQRASTGDMHHRIDQLIAYISQFMTLHPGDIITTGTPAGTALGTDTDHYLKPGQTMTTTIDGLGTQHTPIAQAARPPQDGHAARTRDT